MIIKASLLLSCALLSGMVSYLGGLSLFNAVVVCIFSVSIFGSLFFWNLRLGFMFMGSAIYLLLGAVTPEEFIRYASLDVILFLISMMIVVGMMKDVGLFEWLITLLLRVKNLTGRKLFFILMFGSAIFSSLMGEVASIMVMIMTILGICDFLEIDPVPLIICSILATNIGSAATVLGNPVGVLIAARSGLSFEDFLVNALPNATINLTVITLVLLFIYRKYIKELSERIKQIGTDEGFLRLISIPSDRRTRISMGIFIVTIICIALHRRLELFLGLEENTLLLMFPIFAAGIVLLYRHDKARFYIENEIEWPSILFFMFLFAQAGVIHASGAADILAENIIMFTKGQLTLLVGFILFTSGILSSIVDNVVAVAAFIPLIKEFETMPFGAESLWWALLFGACFGGNITMIGSTANIVALGIMEKRLNVKLVFWQWFRIGAVIGVLSLMVSYFVMIVFGYMG